MQINKLYSCVSLFIVISKVAVLRRDYDRSDWWKGYVMGQVCFNDVKLPPEATELRRLHEQAKPFVAL
jgi:hypothetical protein